MLLSFLVSWRNITRYKARFFFTMTAIILGVAVMTGMLISKETTVKITEEQEKLYAGSADFWIQGNEHYFKESELEWFSDREEVEKGVTSLMKQGFVDIETDLASQASVRLTGVSNLENGLIELPVKEGDMTKEGLIITENAAKLWNKKIGDTLTFKDMGNMEITSIVYEGSMLNSPKTMEEASFRHARVMLPLHVLQEWSDMKGLVSNYRFETKDNSDHDTLLASYQSELSGSNLFVQPVVMDGNQSNDVAGLYYTFDLIAILSVFISAFIAFNMIYASIVERKKEFAVMKSLGYTNGKINSSVLREIGILAVIGTIMGIPLGIWLGAGMQNMLMAAVATQNVSYELELATPIIISAMVGIIFPFLAAAFPVYQAGKTPILEAMTDQVASHSVNKKTSVLRIVVGLLCTVVGLGEALWAFLFLFIGLVLLYPLWIRAIQIIINPVFTWFFKSSGKQAVRSMKQFKNRNANTSAMLAIGVSLALFMSAMLQTLPEGMEHDIRSTFGGDIHAAKETPWTEADLETIEAIKDIDSVDRYADIPNITWQTVEGDYREFSMMTFSEKEKVFTVTNEISGDPQLPAIYLGERSLAEWGGEVGDVLTLNTPAGATDFFVKGSIQTSHYTSYLAFIDEASLESVLNWPTPFHIAIDANEEENIPLIMNQLRESMGSELSNIESVTANVEQSKSALTGMNELMQGLLILIIALSAIGVSNTLFMNTMERVKEIGTMRALGFTRGQVRLMIMAEGLLIGVAGVLIGTLYGILVIYLNSQFAQGQALLSFTVPWVSLILAIAGGILFTIFASWLPSISASRASIKDAINYE